MEELEKTEGGEIFDEKKKAALSLYMEIWEKTKSLRPSAGYYDRRHRAQNNPQLHKLMIDGIDGKASPEVNDFVQKFLNLQTKKLR